MSGESTVSHKRVPRASGISTPPQINDPSKLWPVSTVPEIDIVNIHRNDPTTENEMGLAR